jgi:Rho GDP-dissociation inhibitor
MAAGGNIKVKEIFDKESADKSMIDYFVSLGLDPEYKAPENDDRIVVVQQFEVLFDDGTEPVVLKFATPQDIKNAKKTNVVIKEGSKFKFRVTFRVQHEIVLGFKIHNKVSKMGKTVVKDTEMLGTYPPSNEFKSIEVPRNEWNEAPSGAMYRGEYKSKMDFTDDDLEKNKKPAHLEFAYTIKFVKR